MFFWIVAAAWSGYLVYLTVSDGNNNSTAKWWEDPITKKRSKK
tara:strand:- start:56 stop:184 length:129 start_codon:yes stop_codon:yes gene_type:complete